MTTAEEMWNDLTFINKRIEEQKEYLTELAKKELSDERRIELSQSAIHVLLNFVKRRKELKKLTHGDHRDNQ